VRQATKIAVAGTHSTGKTTFLSTLQGDLESAGYTVARVADLGLGASQTGFPILQHHTHESTLWIITRGISLELEAGLRAHVVLVDRPVPDALGYYHAALTYRADTCPPGYRDYLYRLARNHAATYDLIFKTRLDETIPLGDNKPRDTDHRYRVIADFAVSDVLQDLGVTPKPLTPGNYGDAARLALETVRDRVEPSPAA